MRRCVLALVVLALASVACGSSDRDLSPAAAAGRAVATSEGCAACHGADGQGGVGPAWQGLVGSEVVLADGSVVLADREYIIRSIREPQAEIVDGYTVQMPANDLTDAQIESIIAYVEELSR